MGVGVHHHQNMVPSHLQPSMVPVQPALDCLSLMHCLPQKTPLDGVAKFNICLSCVGRHIQDPASQRLTWNKPPKSVLVIKKIRDASLLQPFKDLCIYLSEVGCCRDVGMLSVLRTERAVGQQSSRTETAKVNGFLKVAGLLMEANCGEH